MSLNFVAMCIGYLVMGAAGTLAGGLLACAAVQQCWRAACGARRMAWLSEAMRHYDKIKPMPGKERSEAGGGNG